MKTRGRARNRAFRRFLVSALALSALTAVLVQPVSAAPRRSAVVSPDQDLGDQVVQVDWQGFRPTQADGSYGVVILQCRHPATADGHDRRGSIGATPIRPGVRIQPRRPEPEGDTRSPIVPGSRPGAAERRVA